MYYSIVGLLTIVMSLFSFLIGDFVGSKEEIEISPNKWLEINKVYLGEVDRVRLAFEWNGKTVTWEGDETIKTLREKDGTLYMICFNRENLDLCHYRFYRLNPSGDGFTRIDAKDFPRAIATKNVGYYWAEEVTPYQNQDFFVSALELERSLDADSEYFCHTGTALIWNYLETGVYTNFVDKDFPREYANKYHPLPLPTIVKETDVSLTIKVGDNYKTVESWLTRHKILASCRKLPSVNLKEFETYRIFDSHILYTEVGFEIKDMKVAKIYLFEDYKDSDYYITPQENNTRFRGIVDELTIYSSLSDVYQNHQRPEMRGNMKNIAREILKRNAKKKIESTSGKSQESHNAPTSDKSGH